ncbi:Inclusion body clearance protein [Podosphaera aphanis]|nr:Inclusion body clearance protein [Podosphaera aphanis]
MSRWFKVGGKPQDLLIAKDEEAHLQQVESALTLLFNDDLISADKILIQADSSYHHLGRGLSSFIASALGAEEEMLRNAATALQDAEDKAWSDMKRAQKEPTAFRSHIYPAGTEYLLCNAIAQLTGAICAVLSGSVIQAVSGFAKLRKAYLSLNGIMEIEAAYFKKLKTQGRLVESRLASTNTKNVIPDQEPAVPKGPHEKNNLETTSSTDEIDSAIEPLNPQLFLYSDYDQDIMEFDPAAMGISSHTDIFIHSGVRVCFGSLLVVFSMIENPVFNKILYIIGFKGDRERGTRYLWQASHFDSFTSTIASLIILMFYNGLCGFSDILPTDPGADNDISGFPSAKSRKLLSKMRKRFPESKLWRLEEARMYAFDQNLTDAVQILSENSDPSKNHYNMKQLEIINTFELSLNAMFYHDLELTAKNWMRCAELSNWSPTLYIFLAGVSYVELFRDLQEKDPVTASKYKKEAIECFRKAPPLAGKQKLMSKQLPFDMYVVRKCQKWEERSKEWSCDIIDSIGVSPLVEMTYLWNGIKKQNPDQLQRSLKCLSWERSAQPTRHKANLDETAIHAVLTACILRNLKKYKEAREVLQTEIFCYNRQDFKGHLRDDWSCPDAYYEMACLAWREKDLEGENHLNKILECEDWLDKSHNWGYQYVLDTRLSMKIMTSISTVKRHRRVMGI